MKKLTIAVVALLVLAVAVPAFAAGDGDNSKLAELFDNLFSIRKQIVDQYVANGLLTPEQGKYMKDRLDYMQKFHAQNGYAWGPGYGMMGPGGCGGMIGGFGFRGPGFGGAFGPYGGNSAQGTNTL